MYLVCATALLAVLYECTCYPVRRCVSDLCIGHVVVVVRSPVVHQPHAHRTWHEGKILKHGCRCAAAAAVLLYTVFFVVARLSGCEETRSTALLHRCAPMTTHSIHICRVHTEAHIHTITHRSTVCGCHKREPTHSAAAVLPRLPQVENLEDHA